MNTKNGFTLIELICALVIVGILATGGALGIIHVTKAFVAARENTQMVQKASLALERISMELVGCSKIHGASSNKIEFSTPGDDTPHILEQTKGAIQLDGNNLIDTLGDNQNFLTFINGEGEPWHDTAPLSDLSLIQITLVMAHSAGPHVFETQITPRNNMQANAPGGENEN